MIPILLFCRNRLRYLDTTLKSLSETTPCGVPIIIANDCSNNSDMIRYLTSNERIDLIDYSYPKTKWTGFIPNEECTFGIKGKFDLILFDRCLGMKNLGDSVKYCFEKYKSKFLIKIEADAIFKKDWYSKFSKFVQYDFGIISGFRHFYDQFKTSDFNEELEELVSGGCGAVAYLISKKLIDLDLNLTENNIFTMENNDDYWINSCRNSNLKFLVCKKGLVQHIGFESEIYNNHKKNKLRVDKNLFPPFKIGNHIRDFLAEQKNMAIL